MTTAPIPRQPAARALLRTLSWYAPEPMPSGLLAAAGTNRGRTALVTAGLLVSLPGGDFTLTQEARDGARAHFGDQGRNHAVRALHRFLGDPGSPGETARCLALLPHLLHWASLTSSEDVTAAVGSLLSRVTRIALENSLGATAVPLAERLVRSASLHGGPRSANGFAARNNLAWAYARAGEYRRSVRLHEQILADRIEQLGPDHEDVWSTRHSLGYSCMKAGDHARAIEITEQIVAHRTRTLGPSHSETLMARHNLAVIHRDAGRQDEALELWEALDAECAASLRPDDETTIAVRVALHEARGERYGTPDDALDDADDARHRLAEAEELLTLLNHGEGRDRGLTAEKASLMVERATALRDLRRLDEAEQAFREVIDEGGRALGSGHPEVVAAWARLGFLHTLREPPDGEAAVAAIRHGLAAADHALGRTHRETAMAAVALLGVLLDQGRLQEHQELLEDRLADIIQALGFQHRLVRALAAHRARLALRRPPSYRP